MTNLILVWVMVKATPKRYIYCRNHFAVDSWQKSEVTYAASVGLDVGGKLFIATHYRNIRYLLIPSLSITLPLIRAISETQWVCTSWTGILSFLVILHFCRDSARIINCHLTTNATTLRKTHIKTLLFSGHNRSQMDYAHATKEHVRLIIISVAVNMH